MKKCIFCDIATQKVDERHRIFVVDDDYLAMNVLQPESIGHFIVFPKKHASEMKDMVNVGAFFEKAVTLAERRTKELNADAYVLKLNNNVYKIEDDKRHVGHIHMHVIPKYKTERSK